MKNIHRVFFAPCLLLTMSALQVQDAPTTGAVAKTAPIGSMGALPLGTSCTSSIDLNTWTAESYTAVSGFPDGMWVVNTNGDAVDQTANGQPTFFYSDFTAIGSTIEGNLTASGDDDYIGFALGFNPGDATNPSANYLLIDWKGNSQGFDFGAPSCSPASTANEGLAVSSVFGIPTADEFWGHNNTDDTCSDLNNGLLELQRGMTLGSTGWNNGITNNFRFEFSPTRLQVFVNSTLELDISGTFGDGRVAFYNFSQAGVTYSAFSQGSLASWLNFGAGWPGSNGVPTLTLSADPVLGSSPTVQLGNSSNAPELGCLFFSMDTGTFPSVFGPVLRVAPPYFISEEINPLPVGGTSYQVDIPSDPTLCGVHVYIELFQSDPGASRGYSLSQAIDATLGE